MNDVVVIPIVVILLVLITVGIASRFPRELRGWIMVGLAEYLLGAVAQLFYTGYIFGGGDSVSYRVTGEWLATLLDRNFSVAAPEVLALVLQRPSMFDSFVYGGGGNTGSMYGVAAWLTYFLRGSGYATCTLVAGLSFFGALGVFAACHRAAREVPPARLFAGVVLFPSLAFWTATLHKEAFCVMGFGLIMMAWAGLRFRRPLRVVLCGPLGVYIVLLFRAPALPTIVLGFAVFYLVERLQKTRGADATIIGPLYLGLGIAALALAMVLVTRIAPSLALERISDSVSHQQQMWAGQFAGSAVGVLAEDAEPLSLAQQLVRVPLALINALLRPQLFDVRNASMLLSAIEMTGIVWFILHSVRRHGAKVLLRRVQRSPFLAMCAVVTVVGCTLIGIVTFNFGSLSRYRAPFLPFYGALLAGMLPATVRKAVPQAPRRMRLAASVRGRSASNVR